MKGSLYSCLLIACLPSGIKTLIWHLETIYMVDWTNVKFTETVSLRWVTKDKWSRCLVGSWAMCEQRMIEGGRVWQVVKTGSTQRWYKLMWATKNPWAVKDKWSQCWGWLHAGQSFEWTPELWTCFASKNVVMKWRLIGKGFQLQNQITRIYKSSHKNIISLHKYDDMYTL